MVQPAYFTPSQAIIIDIENSNPTLVTTYSPHGFKVGVYIRFFIPLERGMQQLSDVIAQITAVTSTTFTVAIDSTSYEPFIPTSDFPLNTYRYLAQAIPVSENGLTLSSATKNNGTMLPYVTYPYRPQQV
jgi:hypothetical protein